MARVSPIITSFNAGELSPQLYGRVDVEKYVAGCRKMENFIPLVHGPARRRPGSYFVAEVKDSSKVVRLIPFEFSITQAYILEFGEQYIRFYKDQGQIESGGSPYEIASPYLEADLEGLKFAQDADTMYIVHPLYVPRKLTRTGHTSWTLSLVDFNNGPYLDEQSWNITGNDLIVNGSMEVDANWTSVGTPTTNARSSEKYSDGGYSRKFTVDAAAEGIKSDAFTTVAGKCYRLTFKVYTAAKTALIAIRKGDNSGWAKQVTLVGIPDSAWKEYTIFWIEPAGGTGAYIEIDSAAATSGTWYIDQVTVFEIDATLLSFSARKGTSVTVTASEAIFEASHVGSSWRIRHPFTCNDNLTGSEDEGWLKITGYTSSTVVTASIESELKDWAETPYFSEGAFSAKRGYPSAIALHKECMWLANTLDYPQTLWRSTVGSYEDFSPGTDADSGFSYTLSSEKVNAITWIAPVTHLIVGTNNGEWTIEPPDSNKPLSPTNVEANQQSAYGCAETPPINLRNVVLFMQRLGLQQNYGEIARELSYHYDLDGYVARNLTLLAEHITKGGVVEWAYMSSPFPIVWAARADGTLLGMTYEKDQEVYAWHRHPMAGAVESVAVIPGAYQDELWMVVRRTINGVEKRYVEFLTDFDWTGPINDPGYTGGGTYRNRPFFVDCGLSYFGSVPVTTISGLDHLVGATVQILADGAVIPNQVVSAGGSITLTTAATVVHVGLAYVSDLEPMDLEAGAMEGTAQGKKKRLHEVGIKLFETVGGLVGPDASHLDEIITRNMNDPLGSPPPLFTGDYELAFPGGYSTAGRILIRQDKPLPMTVLCLMPRLDTMDR